MRNLAFAAALVAAMTGVVHADSSVQDKVVAQLEAQLAEMSKGVWKGRLSGCGGWECDDATVYIKLPGKIDIRYDYGSRVVADGKWLRVLNGSGDEVRADKLAETSLGLLLDGKLDDVAAVEEIDRGTTAGEPRHVYSIELTSDTAPALTLFATKAGFKLLGWRVADGRGEFTATIRGLRKIDGGDVRKLPTDLFTTAKSRSRKGRR